MPFEALVKESGVRLVLTGRLGVQQARPLWDCLAVVMAHAATISIDAENLVDMDTSIVQILLQLKSSTSAVSIAACAPGFTEALRRRGLAEMFTDNTAQAQE